MIYPQHLPLARALMSYFISIIPEHPVQRCLHPGEGVQVLAEPADLQQGCFKVIPEHLGHHLQGNIPERGEHLAVPAHLKP